METPTKKAPIQKFRAKAITCSAWKNKGKNGEFLTFSITRSFKKPDTEEWSNTGSMRTNDLPLVAQVVNEAFKWSTTEQTLNKKEEKK